MNKAIKYICICTEIAYLAFCAYFILLNAYWLPGDDAIVMNATGWGHPFVPPREPFSIGRFFPLSYSFYNFLLLIPHDIQIDIHYMYALQVFAMCVFAFFMSILCLQMMNKYEDKYRYPITLLVTVFAIARLYPELIKCYTAIWMVYLLIPVFLYCLWKFIETQRTSYAIVALVSINYAIYCYETIFTIPITIGVCALLFNYKKLSRKDLYFYISLIVSAVLFLLLYLLLVVPQIETAYDGAHGKDITILGNAIKVFIAQKTMWVVAVLLIIRLYDCIKNNVEVNLYDYLLLASCAYCCGATVLRLNFIYYYNVAVIVAIPAILYFALYYVKPIGTLVLFFLFAAFYGIKQPEIIAKTQKDRLSYHTHMADFADRIHSGTSVFWYMPEHSVTSDFDFEGRSWRHGYTSSGIGWDLAKEDFIIPIREQYSNERGLWFVVDGDTISFLNETNYSEIIYANDGIKCYLQE